MQADVDAIASKFVAAVSRGRHVGVSKVKSDFGRGRVMFADAAKAVGLIDNVGNLDPV